MKKLLLSIWHFLPGTIQWYVLWLMHPKFVIGVSGIIFNKKGEVLLIKHKHRRKDLVWGLPSGHAERAERLGQTLIREVFEETGYEIDVDSLLQVESGSKLRVEVTYIGRFIGGDLKIDPAEVSDVGFFPINQLPEEMMENHRGMIKKAIELRQMKAFT